MTSYKALGISDCEENFMLDHWDLALFLDALTVVNCLSDIYFQGHK